MDQYIEQETDAAILEQIKNDDMSMVNRNTIKRIKKKLVANDKEYECLKLKFLGGNGVGSNYFSNFDGDHDGDFSNDDTLNGKNLNKCDQGASGGKNINQNMMEEEKTPENYD